MPPVPSPSKLSVHKEALAPPSQGYYYGQLFYRQTIYISYIIYIGHFVCDLLPSLPYILYKRKRAL